MNCVPRTLRSAPRRGVMRCSSGVHTSRRASMGPGSAEQRGKRTLHRSALAGHDQSRFSFRDGHSFPFSLQFECGVDEPIHDYQWLCPVHHKYVHVLLSGHLLGSRDLSFLDCIRDEDAEEWLAIERSAQKGFDLCCETLGRVPGQNQPKRYDPEFGLFLINNPGMVRAAVEWNRKTEPLIRFGAIAS